jgi:hypothetical protein
MTSTPPPKEIILGNVNDIIKRHVTLNRNHKLEYAFLNEKRNKLFLLFGTSLKEILSSYFSLVVDSNSGPETYTFSYEDSKYIIQAVTYTFKDLFSFSLTQGDLLTSLILNKENIVYMSEEFKNKIQPVAQSICPNIVEIALRLMTETSSVISKGSSLFKRGYFDSNYQKELENAATLLLFHYYLSNISETSSLSAVLTEEQQALYELVNTSQNPWPYLEQCSRKTHIRFLKDTTYLTEPTLANSRNQVLLTVLYHYLLDQENELVVFPQPPITL